MLQCSTLLARQTSPPRLSALGRHSVEPIRQRRKGGDCLRPLGISSGKSRFSGGELLLQCFILALQRLDMAFKSVHEQRIVRAFERRSTVVLCLALSAFVRRSNVVRPPVRQPYARALVVANCLLPAAAERPQPYTFDRRVQPFGGLSVGEPFIRHENVRVNGV